DTRDPNYLVASHIKGWRHSNNMERLDPNNGLLLAPHIDKLFDKGQISFSDEGNILIKSNDVKRILKKWGVDISRKIIVNSKELKYIRYHREKYFKKKN
ncbi:HNH endonuclease signature motif containing protein, partial [Roseibium sp. RKSG952]|uniref:HNH endonuclease signature motif containing protein n=1 Tax=Roseibium sp. RKSG952 TaxID=2529384 RepID=UPI0013CC5BAC